MELIVDEILKEAVRRQASDIHFTVGLPPQLRIDGIWTAHNSKKLGAKDCEVVAEQMLGKLRMEQFKTLKDYDTSYSIPGVGRFRINVFYQRGSVGVAVRVLPYRIPDFEELGLPVDIMRKLCEQPNGLVLICGPTGSGKSTTLASMVSYINKMSKRHIVTIEDPVEFLHSHEKSIVDQREVGSDTDSFTTAMKHVLRQSPDVVLVGEIREPEGVRTALMIAETGHLLLSTLHAGESVQALSRMVDMFPPQHKEEVRVSLALVLRGVIVQQLLPTPEGGRRVLATEVMIANSAIRNLVREGKFDLVYSQIQLGQREGMHTMNLSLLRLWKEGMISWEMALSKSPNIPELRKLMEHA